MSALPVTEARARLPGRLWLAMAALLFCAVTTLTIAICTSMASKGGLPMPGGWTMSMAWARMCGQTWPGAAAAFVGMWTAMTMAMMLPALLAALLPVLGRGRAEGAGWGQPRFTLLVGVGYFAIWIAAGMTLYPAGAGLAALVLRLPLLARTVPLAGGLVVLMAGRFQLSATKARYLACCRSVATCDPAMSGGAGTALRCGARLGLHCCGCCAGFTAALLAAGLTDWRAMALASAAITAERFARDGARMARIAGWATVGAGIVLVVQAVAAAG
jgi:predicted metal-binding membrane protein